MKKKTTTIRIDLKTDKKISHISKALGLKKAQTIRFLIDPLFEMCTRNHVICKVIKNPMRDAVIFMFFPNESYMLAFPQGKQIKKAIEEVEKQNE